jgi:Co/Zn/Cd efflux system component
MDYEGPEKVREWIRRVIEMHDDNRISDLHVWSVGPGLYTSIVSIVTHQPKSAQHYKDLIPAELGLVHVVVEVHHCVDDISSRLD